jgi:nitrogen-specific signal transduction histidine kinase
MIAYDDGRRRRSGRRNQPLVDVLEAVRGVHELVVTQLDDSLRLMGGAHGPPMLVDINRRLLEQALLNLIFHAHDRRASNPGTIRLDVARIGARATPGANPHESADASYARLRVTDDGPELSADDRASLFEPGAAGEVRGLAVACIIVQEAGGAVTAEHGPDGTSISVFLPIVPSLVRAPGSRQE